MSDDVRTFVAQPLLIEAQTAMVADQDCPQTTISAGSDGDGLPTAVIHLTSTAALPASGTVWIYDTLGWESVAYTGKTGGGDPTITGCTTSGVGGLLLGQVVAVPRVVTLAVAWLIHMLAPTTAAGTSETDAQRVGIFVTTALRFGTGHTRWVCVLMQDGYYRIVYSGTGRSKIEWTTSAALAAEIGFASTPIVLLVPGTATAAFPPAHCILSHFVPTDGDSQVQAMPAFRAISRTKGGRVDSLEGGSCSAARMFTTADHPRTPAIALSRGTQVTPMQPDDNDRVRLIAPIAAAEVVPGKWTVHHSVNVGFGLRRAYTFGNFKELAGSSPTITYFDYGYWTENVTKSKTVVHTAGWTESMDRTGLELTLLGVNGTIT